MKLAWILSASMLLMLLSPEKAISYPKYLNMRVPSGPMVEGTWVFQVGASKKKYTVHLEQVLEIPMRDGQMWGSYLTGYMISPEGERFDFTRCPGNSYKDKDPSPGTCSILTVIPSNLDIFTPFIKMSAQQIRTTNWGFILREGESAWIARFANPNGSSPWYFTSGQVVNVYTRKFQASFTGKFIK